MNPLIYGVLRRPLLRRLLRLRHTSENQNLDMSDGDKPVTLGKVVGPFGPGELNKLSSEQPIRIGQRWEPHTCNHSRRNLDPRRYGKSIRCPSTVPDVDCTSR